MAGRVSWKLVAKAGKFGEKVLDDGTPENLCLIGDDPGDSGGADIEERL